VDPADALRRTAVPDWSSLVKPSLLGVAPYDPGASLSELRARHGLDELVKLNWNEGLFGPAPGVLEAAASELENAWQYPEQAYADFRDAVAAEIGASPAQIVPGHGIQALVTTVAASFVTPGTAAVVPRPTYGLHAQVLRAAGADVTTVPLGDGLRLDLGAMAEAARRAAARLVVVVDPNNPTGDHLGRDEWEAFLDALPGDCVAVIDEAYADYVDPPLRLDRVRDVAAGRPVVLLRTFSKLFGLAGLRLGYAVAHEELAAFLHVVQEPFNVNRAALAAGRASLSVPGLVERRRRETAEARDLLARLLGDAGCEPFPSQANFVLARIDVDDVELAEQLLRRGFLIRAGSEFGLERTIRVTVGPASLMERFGEALAAALGELRAAAVGKGSPA
jgi:histidinol-phosphate aminotransferase